MMKKAKEARGPAVADETAQKFLQMKKQREEKKRKQQMPPPKAPPNKKAMPPPPPAFSSMPPPPNKGSSMGAPPPVKKTSVVLPSSRSMPAPPKPAAAAPKKPAPVASTALASLGYGSDSDGSDSDGDGDGDGGAAGRALPPGFFDGDSGPPGAASAQKEAPSSALADVTRNRGTVNTGLGGAADEEAGGAQPDLPAGFFDNVQEDADAQGRDLVAEKETQQADDWAEFQAFSAEMDAKTQQQVEEEEKDEEDVAERAVMEQMTYVNRLQQLHARAAAKAAAKTAAKEEKEAAAKKAAEAAAKEEEDAEAEAASQPSLSSAGMFQATVGREEVAELASAPKRAASTGVAQIMLQKRKRKEAELAEANEKEYVPLDPSDWRLTQSY